MTLKRILAMCVVFVLGMAGPMFAQSDRATIMGTVTDISSAVLPGVQVTVKNLGTGDEQVATTTGTGLYRAGNLPIGSYTVSFSKADLN